MLPPALLVADDALHKILEKYSFSLHLNPVNVTFARAQFLAGMEEPPLVYHAPIWAEDALRVLDSLEIPLDHPMGIELSQVAEGVRRFIVALQERTPEAFEALNEHSRWFPLLDPLQTPPEDGVFLGGGAASDRMKELLLLALRERDFDDWSVVDDPVMSARILVDAPKKLIRINPSAMFTGNDLRGLIAHEIDVHVTRGVHGARQPLKVFTAGLSGADLTEEGLAIFAEETVGTLSPRFVWRQQVLHHAVELAKTAGFREVFEWARPYLGGTGAWTMTLRIKRGLARPGLSGVYAKDVIYLRGWRLVHQFLENGGDIASLFVGKVGTHHPVESWLKEGFVQPQPLPRLFAHLCPQPLKPGL